MRWKVLDLVAVPAWFWYHWYSGIGFVAAMICLTDLVGTASTAGLVVGRVMAAVQLWEGWHY